jgi:SAM-dependent methyltransferase
MPKDQNSYWSNRARCISNDREVNIQDCIQRDIEYGYILPKLNSKMRVLEIGCGNGYTTAQIRKITAHVDAFDISEEMIGRATSSFGEDKNRFFVDSILEPTQTNPPYDVVICIRVLINLAGLESQKKAISVIAGHLQPMGRLILVEGFMDGFNELNKLRKLADMPSIQPAPVNYYSSLEDLLPFLNNFFEIEDTFHLGTFDYLTRVVYPMVVGADRVQHNSAFVQKLGDLTKISNDDCFEKLSRVRGFFCRRRS